MKWLCVAIFTFTLCSISAAAEFRVATYNVENYLDQPTEIAPLRQIRRSQGQSP
jgi:hypothetical protein